MVATANSEKHRKSQPSQLLEVVRAVAWAKELFGAMACV